MPTAAETLRSTRVRVVEDDYIKAVRNASGRCAIARAVRRAFPDAERVMVDIQTIRFTFAGERLTWLTPPAGQDMIVAFDAGEWSRLEPFDFTLRRDKAHKVTRLRPADDENRRKQNAAVRTGQSRAGIKRVGDPGAPKPPKRSAGGANRAYGARALYINQAREQDGLIREVEDPQLF